jgi:hypothetical protein
MRLFIDFGEVAPRYDGDVKASGKLLLRYVELFTWTKDEMEAIKNAASALSQDDVRLCLQILNRQSMECVEVIPMEEES